MSDISDERLAELIEAYSDLLSPVNQAMSIHERCKSVIAVCRELQRRRRSSASEGGFTAEEREASNAAAC